MTARPQKLLETNEPLAFTIEHGDGASPFFITCDHAGKRLPRKLGKLGLPDHELERHIAWDIGASAVSTLLGDALDAFVIHQTYSRLAIDCNRNPAVDTSIVTLSETTVIPGNLHLDPVDRQQRINEIFMPYHDRIVAELDARQRAKQPTVLIALHSFTPVFKGKARPWHIGILYNRDPALPHILLDLLRAEGDLVVGDNEPYAVGDSTDYTIPVHGERRHLPHVEFEIRQDLIGDAAGQRRWADRLTRILPIAYRRLCGDSAS